MVRCLHIRCTFEFQRVYISTDLEIIQSKESFFCEKARAVRGAVYSVVAVEALLWDWSFFLSYFNQYLLYINTEQFLQASNGAQWLRKTNKVFNIIYYIVFT